MNTTEQVSEDSTFPQACRICGGRIDEGDDWVFNENEYDAAYSHAACD